MSKKTSPALDEIREYITSHPNEAPTTVATRFRIQPQRVYSLRAELKKKGVKLDNLSTGGNGAVAKPSAKKSKRTRKLITKKQLDEVYKNSSKTNAINTVRQKVTRRPRQVVPRSELQEGFPKTAIRDIYMEVTLPDVEGKPVVDADLVLKLRTHDGMLCTLTLDETGLQYQKANSKKPGRKLSWEVIEKLAEIGL